MCVPKRRLPLLGLLTLLASCRAAGPAGGFCEAARPILVDPDDRLTRATAVQLLAHNESGARLCGWGALP